MQEAMSNTMGRREYKMIRHGVVDGLPVCPRPRRAATALPEFLSPPNCEHSGKRRQGDDELLVSGKRTSEGREAIGIGCPPSCYCGSPPTRSHNPMVKDVYFIQQMNQIPQWPYANLSDKFMQLRCCEDPKESTHEDQEEGGEEEEDEEEEEQEKPISSHAFYSLLTQSVNI